MVSDPRSENTLVIVGADLFLTVIGNSLSRESGNVIRLYSKDCRAHDLFIKGFQVTGLLKHNMCSALDLLDCPSITKAKGLCHRAAAPCKDIQDFMEVFGIDPVRKLLSRRNIRDFEKGIVLHAVREILFL